jgi:hypothetical protein
LLFTLVKLGVFKAACTNAVVAILVSLSPKDGVGAVGLPVNAGEAIGALSLNVSQSVDVKYPSTEVVAAGILRLGVVPLEDTSGAVAVTSVTGVPT